MGDTECVACESMGKRLGLKVGLGQGRLVLPTYCTVPSQTRSPGCDGHFSTTVLYSTGVILLFLSHLSHSVPSTPPLHPPFGPSNVFCITLQAGLVGDRHADGIAFYDYWSLMGLCAYKLYPRIVQDMRHVT